MRSIFSVSDTGGLVEKIQVLQTGVEAITVRLLVQTSTTKPCTGDSWESQGSTRFVEIV